MQKPPVRLAVAARTRVPQLLQDAVGSSIANLPYVGRTPRISCEPLFK